MNTWDISGMFVVLWSIPANIKTCEFARKPTISFIIIPCGLLLLMPDWLFFLTIHVPEIFLVFVWGLWFVSKKIKALGFIYLIWLLGNINFCKKGHPYIHIARKTIIYSSFLLGILNFFLYNLSLTFLSILQNPSYLAMFWKFPYPSQVGYQNLLKGWHQKWQLRMAVSHLWFQAFQVSKAFSWPSKLVWDTLFCDWGV